MPDDVSTAVEFVTDGAIARIILNRPAKRNAISPAMAAGLEAALGRLEDDPDLRVGVVSGAGPVFSAGADLGYVARGEGEQLSTERGGFAGFVRYPRRKPLIAAVHGYALAGGFEIVLACDLIVSEDTAQFGLPEVTRGLIANGGGVLRLASMLPRAQALDLVLTGRRLEAAEAARLGLVTRIVGDGCAAEQALALAATIAAHPPAAVRESLYLARAAGREPSAEMWTLCAEIARRVRETSDAVEGARAFLDRREASWTKQ
ncbi:MAG: enoyl-CoA hydratase-related protein [Actinomycetota bacterium]|nr:enoyl-CoA hydratase-related protein [Actinomycetota bacterium]